MNNQFDHIAQVTHRIMAMVSKIIVLVSDSCDTRLSGIKAYPKLDENRRVIELHWATQNITLIVNIFSRENPLSISVFMPDNADKDLQRKLWKVSEIVKSIIVEFGGNGIPRIDRLG